MSNRPNIITEADSTYFFNVNLQPTQTSVVVRKLVDPHDPMPRYEILLMPQGIALKSGLTLTQARRFMRDKGMDFQPEWE